MAEARHFTPRKYRLLTQEAMAPSRHDWKIVDWDVKPQHNQNGRVQNAVILWKHIFMASHFFMQMSNVSSLCI